MLFTVERHQGGERPSLYWDELPRTPIRNLVYVVRLDELPNGHELRRWPPAAAREAAAEVGAAEEGGCRMTTDSKEKECYERLRRGEEWWARRKAQVNAARRKLGRWRARGSVRWRGRSWGSASPQR